MLALRTRAVPAHRFARTIGFGLESVARRGYAAAATAVHSVVSTPPPSLPPLPGRASKGDSVSTTGATTVEAETETTVLEGTQGRRRRVKVPRRRADISVSSPRKWNPPLAEGVLPAYDLAVKLIRQDSLAVKKEVEEVRNVLEEKVGAGVVYEEEEEEVRKRLRKLEVASEVNLPEVRWRVKNAMEDMTKPVHRHLVEQRWRKDGDLDLLMERLHQMNVIPDVLPSLHPTIDLHVSARTTYKEMALTRKKHATVEPGSFLLPEQTLEPPVLHVNVFHADTRLYTLLLVDPDVVDEEQESFTTFLHWLKPNVPLSATTRTKLTGLNDHTSYIPPHPQCGTPYHRYVLLMLPQPPLEGTEYTLTSEARATPGVPTSAQLDIAPVEKADRLHFDVRAFVEQWGLDGVRGGAHMWREVWDSKVTKIYKTVLHEAEPRYGRRPKTDRYADVKRTKRYI